MFQKKLEITGHAGAVYCCLVSDGFVYSGGADHYLTRWDLSTGEQDKFAIKFEHSVYAIEIIENNILVVGLSSGDLHFFNLEERKEVKYFTQHKKAIFSIASRSFIRFSFTKSSLKSLSFPYLFLIFDNKTASFEGSKIDNFRGRPNKYPWDLMIFQKKA